MSLLPKTGVTRVRICNRVLKLDLPHAVGKQPRERLSALPGVTQALFENGHPTLYTEDVPRTMAGLFELVSADELAFKDMVVRQATLEDVFLKLTGRRIRS